MSKLLPLPSILSSFYDSDSIIYYKDNELYYNSDVSDSIVNDINNHCLQIFAGYYEYEKGWWSPKIFLIGRGKESGKVKIKIENFLPYCYIQSKYGTRKTLRGTKVEKIMFRGPPIMVKRFRKLLSEHGYHRPYEADIPFVRRFLCDIDDYFIPKEQIKPKVAILDIETNHPIGNEIISFALNSDGVLYFNSIHMSDPFDLLLDLYFKLIEHDIVTGWNIDFDIERIEFELTKLKRYLAYLNSGMTLGEYKLKLKELGLSDDGFNNLIKSLSKYGLVETDSRSIRRANINFEVQIKKHCAIIDMMQLVKKMYGRQIKFSWSLDNVGRIIAGLGKYDLNGHYPHELSFDELLEYNVRDVIIPEIIDEYFGCIPCHLILSTMIQSLLEDSLITAVVNDIVILRAYHKDKIVLPSRPEWNNDSREIHYEAAKPLAREGVYRGILKFDVVHSYPWAVTAINASIETKDKNGKYKSPNGIHFNDGYSTFVNQLFKLMKERGEVKTKLNQLIDKYGKNSEIVKKYKHIDFALKTQTAAFSHGIFGWERSRMKDYEVASAITSTARDLIFFAMRHADLLGHKWVYQHTDSLYINAPREKMEKIVSYFDSIISKYCKERGYKTQARLEFKDYYEMIYVHSAGRNVLLPDGVDIDDDENWEVTGMNFYRSETPEELADIEVGLIKLIFRNSTDEEKLEYLRERIKNLSNVDVRKLGLIKPLNKAIKKYGRKAKHSDEIVGIPNHIKALMRAEREYGLKVNIGDKFMVLPIITNETTGVRKIRRKRVDIAFLPDKGLPNEYKIDYETYLKSNLFGKINKMFNMSEKELFEKCKDVIPRIDV